MVGTDFAETCDVYHTRSVVLDSTREAQVWKTTHATPGDGTGDETGDDVENKFRLVSCLVCWFCFYNNVIYYYICLQA